MLPPPKKLTDLNGRWTAIWCPDRRVIGVGFDCPTHGPPCRHSVMFRTGLEGYPIPDKYVVYYTAEDVKKQKPQRRNQWARTGTTIETLTLSPSIFATTEKGGCGWHGFVENGHARTV